MEKLFRIITLSSLFLILLSFTACSNDDDKTPTLENTIVGIWEPLLEQNAYKPCVLVFKSDKSAVRYIVDVDKSDDSGFVFTDTIYHNNYAIVGQFSYGYIVYGPLNNEGSIDDIEYDYIFENLDTDIVSFTNYHQSSADYRKVKSIKIKK